MAGMAEPTVPTGPRRRVGGSGPNETHAVPSHTRRPAGPSPSLYIHLHLGRADPPSRETFISPPRMAMGGARMGPRSGHIKFKKGIKWKDLSRSFPGLFTKGLSGGAAYDC